MDSRGTVVEEEKHCIRDIYQFRELFRISLDHLIYMEPFAQRVRAQYRTGYFGYASIWRAKIDILLIF